MAIADVLQLYSRYTQFIDQLIKEDSSNQVNSLNFLCSIHKIWNVNFKDCEVECNKHFSGK